MEVASSAASGSTWRTFITLLIFCRETLIVCGKRVGFGCLSLEERKGSLDSSNLSQLPFLSRCHKDRDTQK